MQNDKKNKRLICYHASTKKYFKPSSKYVWALEDYCRRYNDAKASNYTRMLDNYIKDYQQQAKDPGFARFFFASSVRDCRSVEDHTLEISLRYDHLPKSEGKDKIRRGSENHNVHLKFCRNIATPRGRINVLVRETNTHCNCIDDKKKEAKGMPKLAFCNECEKEFPQEQTSLCKCKDVACCSTRCQDHCTTCSYRLWHGYKQAVRKKRSRNGVPTAVIVEQSIIAARSASSHT